MDAKGFTRYVADRPENNDQWWRDEAAAKRIIKKKFGTEVKLVRDMKPRGRIKMLWGMYSLHMPLLKKVGHLEHCIAKNLTLDDIANIQKVLNTLGTPTTTPEGLLHFPQVERNQY